MAQLVERNLSSSVAKWDRCFSALVPTVRYNDPVESREALQTSAWWCHDDKNGLTLSDVSP
eukprot:12896841-Prorocentrum_lima.AAC.1